MVLTRSLAPYYHYKGARPYRVTQEHQVIGVFLFLNLVCAKIFFIKQGRFSMGRPNADRRQCMYCGAKFHRDEFHGNCPKCELVLAKNEILKYHDPPVYASLSGVKFKRPVSASELLCRKCSEPFSSWESFTTPEKVLCQDCAAERLSKGKG